MARKAEVVETEDCWQLAAGGSLTFCVSSVELVDINCGRAFCTELKYFSPLLHS